MAANYFPENGLQTLRTSRVSASAAIDAMLSEARLSELGGLPLPTGERPSAHHDVPRAMQDELIRSRLGVAASLFSALRCKHAETAAHSIRTALYCSAWAIARGMPEEERVALEIAALLHDIGKIGLPEQILTKPSRLTAEERAIVNRHRLMGVEILSTSCASFKVLEIVSNAPSWFDGTRLKLDGVGEKLPLGSRMIAVADAYDSMTTPQIYRAAFSHDRAMNELRDNAGKQFDPTLVCEFEAIPTFNPAEFYDNSAKNWLEKLGPRVIDSCWQLRRQDAFAEERSHESLFQRRLLDNMYDAVIFVDTQPTVTFWNRGSERLTGVASGTVNQRLFTPDLLSMRDERGVAITVADCPVLYALKSRVQSMRRMLIRGRNGEDLAANVHTIPVVDDQGILHGATILLHDATGEVSLEEQCQDWQARATLDPLTKLPNRAEFDHGLKSMIKSHVERRAVCGLIITDIDRFKSVNDTYGHQVGDEVLIAYAQLLMNTVPSECLAARYGGEEFVVLCPDADVATTTALAERIRVALAQIAHLGMGGKSVTASFGVTEMLPGDTPEIMLRRADRGLYTAKEEGRNRVVTLGGGSRERPEERRKKRWWQWGAESPRPEVKRTLLAAVPLSIAVEKLRGFVCDYEAVVVRSNDQEIQLEILPSGEMLKRGADRPEKLLMDLEFEEVLQDATDRAQRDRKIKATRIVATVTPKRGRNRRREGIEEAAKMLLTGLRSYLMAEDVPDDQRPERRK